MSTPPNARDESKGKRRAGFRDGVEIPEDSSEAHKRQSMRLRNVWAKQNRKRGRGAKLCKRERRKKVKKGWGREWKHMKQKKTEVRGAFLVGDVENDYTSGGLGRKEKAGPGLGTF